MFLCRPDDVLPVRRNLQILALFLVAPDIAKQTRLATVHIYRPRLLLGHFCLACRICRGARLVHLTATRVYDRLPVWRQPHARDRLPIVTLVMRHLSRHEIRRVCDPDVALAFVVEDPRHTRRMRRARQAIGKWRTQYLLQREAFSKTDDRQRYGAENNNKPVKKYFQHGRELSRGTMTRRLELHGAGTPSSRSVAGPRGTGRLCALGRPEGGPAPRPEAAGRMPAGPIVRMAGLR